MFVADLKLSDESQARLIAHHISLNLALNAKVGRKKKSKLSGLQRARESLL
jgi:hypothetical protein